MPTRKFFGRVLADTPNHVLTFGTLRADKKIFWNDNFATLDEAAAAAIQQDNKGITVYHALGSFSDNVQPNGHASRKAIQATTFKTLACDIDVGADKPYASQGEAAKALAAALKAFNMPAPMVVSSGYGLHCYWPLKAPVDKMAWVAASTALRDKLVANSLQVDTGKVCDPSMVLRPVGTKNRKGAQSVPVAMLRDCPDYDFAVLFGLLGVAGGALAPARAPGKPRKSALLDAVLESHDLPPADAVQVAMKCAQIGAVASTRGNVPEPLWYLSLGVAAHCVDTEVVALRWSDGHPDYTESATRKKLQQWRDHSPGPATCAKFESLNAATCAKCIHRGKVRSPVQLSVPKADVLPVEVKLPWGYQIADGKTMRVVQGVAETFCGFPLIVKERRFDPATNKVIALLEARMPIEGVKEIELPIDILAAGKEKFTSFLYNNSIAPGRHETSVVDTRQYLMTYLEDLQRRTKPVNTYNHFGWVEDNSAFILGGNRYAADGVTEVQLSQNISTDMRATFAARGTLNGWLEAAAHYGEPGLEYYAMCLLIGMGTPLLSLTGLEGLIVSMYCSDTGTGKSTTGHMISSVWGHPSRVQIGRNDTLNAIYNTLVQLNHLPAYFDEITNMEPAVASDLTYNVAGGRERRRLNEQAKLREAGTWDLVMFASSNSSFVGKLQSSKLSSKGELQRVIEYPFSKNAVFNGTKNGTAKGDEVARLILNNYGHVGPMLMTALTKVPELQKLIVNAYSAFKREFNHEFDAKERYVQAAHVIAYIAAKVGTKLGVIPFDYHRVIAASLAHTTHAKTRTEDNHADALDIFGMFTNEHTHMTIYERTDTSMPNPLPRVNNEIIRGEIRARFEVTHNGKGKLEAGMFYVDRAYFNRWCQEHGTDAGDVVSQLKAKGVKVEPSRISLGRRSQVVTSAVWCYQIDLTHHEFASRLAGVDQTRNSMIALVVGGKQT